MKYAVSLVYLLCGFMIGAKPVTAAPLSTLDVVQGTVKALPHCMHYQVEGRCLWKKKTHRPPFVKFKHTLLVSEYLPDMVVSVFTDKDTNPWEYPNTLIDPMAYDMGNDAMHLMGAPDIQGGNEHANNSLDTNDHFKEVDVIGDPLAGFFQAPFFIESLVTPYTPYYVSLADSLQWRNATYEVISHPQALIPFYDAIGSVSHGNWGTLYPRIGFLNQPIDAKAAAVMAERGVSIVTDNGGTHVHVAVGAGNNACGEHCDVGEIKVNDTETQWQMLYPTVDESCSVFGTQQGVPGSAWDNEETQAGGGNYVWNYWRHYEGCVQPGGGWHLVNTVGG